jgi:glutathione S-transferase
LKINSKGYVPAIELDDGQVLTEVAVILQYLADRKPESGFAPAAGTTERYRFQECLRGTARPGLAMIGRRPSFRIRMPNHRPNRK